MSRARLNGIEIDYKVSGDGPPVLLRHVGAGRAVIGGLSLGGYASLGFNLAHPEMVRALVICDSGPGYRNAEARAAWNQRAHERAAELESRDRKSTRLNS